MSYEEFKKRIDTARNILVGAVPSPAGQIDQITYALMYKFMNDIDDQASALPGGRRTYFTGDYEKYNWHALMSQSLGAYERLDLYRQAIEGMAKNANLPALFREIYQNAFLPFNSPNVLTLFLKEISKFNHGDSDDIGDAYEYLLSITGSQGDVGQFRTPRHIIKFIVEVVNPTKDDKVLDPAVGTAGFLIAAYDHVKSQHDGKDEKSGKNEEVYLSADETSKIHKNYRGFDIDPTMVRTANVNMYLHGFTTPDIINHDSLSSEDYWNDRYDVILANPPFMTPKGGIQPHKKFSVAANRAEVLFVDYITSHLKPNGRAGIVVPEGIIFQSGNAYKQLRKNLVEDYLYAVVSLPAGVFQPYSGVKTSVLLIDKDQAKKRDEVLFVKIENDGYSTGSQRRKIAGDQFPEALEVIERFKNGEELQTEFAHAVKRSKIAENKDYNLSGDRYISSVQIQSDHVMVALGEVVEIDNGNAFKSSEYVEDGARVIRITNVQKGKIVDTQPKFMALNRLGEFAKYELKANDLLMSLTGNVGRVGLIKEKHTPALLNQRVARLRPKETKILKDYLFHVLNSDTFEVAATNSSSGIAQKNLSTEWLKTYTIPLPRIETQREIVSELDGYQKIIDAAQKIVKTYKPTVKINPEWERIPLDQVLSYEQPTKYIVESVDYKDDYDTPVLTAGKSFILGYTDETKGIFDTSKLPVIIFDDFTTATKLVNFPFKVKSSAMKILHAKDDNDIRYVYLVMQDIVFKFDEHKRFWISQYSKLQIPLPSIEVQKQIVAELEAEQKLIDANKQLIETFQQKIKDKISEVWGE